MHDVKQLKKMKPFGVVSDTKWSSIDDYVQILKSHKQLELYVESVPMQVEKLTLDFKVVEHTDERP